MNTGALINTGKWREWFNTTLIKEIAVDNLFPDEMQRRQRPELTTSLAEWLQRGNKMTPLFVDVAERQGNELFYRIVDGQHRHAAAKSLGYSKVPCYLARDRLSKEQKGIIMNACDMDNRISGYYDDEDHIAHIERFCTIGLLSRDEEPTVTYGWAEDHTKDGFFHLKVEQSVEEDGSAAPATPDAPARGQFRSMHAWIAMCVAEEDRTMFRRNFALLKPMTKVEWRRLNVLFRSNAAAVRELVGRLEAEQIDLTEFVGELTPDVAKEKAFVGKLLSLLKRCGHSFETYDDALHNLTTNLTLPTTSLTAERVFTMLKCRMQKNLKFDAMLTMKKMNEKLRYELKDCVKHKSTVPQSPFVPRDLEEEVREPATPKIIAAAELLDPAKKTQRRQSRQLVTSPPPPSTDDQDDESSNSSGSDDAGTSTKTPIRRKKKPSNTSDTNNNTADQSDDEPPSKRTRKQQPRKVEAETVEETIAASKKPKERQKKKTNTKQVSESMAHLQCMLSAPQILLAQNSIRMVDSIVEHADVLLVDETAARALIDQHPFSQKKWRQLHTVFLCRKPSSDKGDLFRLLFSEATNSQIASEPEFTISVLGFAELGDQRPDMVIECFTTQDTDSRERILRLLAKEVESGRIFPEECLQMITNVADSPILFVSDSERLWFTSKTFRALPKNATVFCSDEEVLTNLETRINSE